MRSFFAMIASWFKKLFDFIFHREEVEPVDDPGDIVCYYGCPNSKKAKKLQLNRKPYEA